MKCGDLFMEEVVMRCRGLARKLGGNVRVVTDVMVSKNISDCPFSIHLSLNWDRKVVYVDEKIDRSDVSGIIHEMGHVFASNRPPGQSKEWEFFGWEYAVAIQLGLLYQWDRGTRDYSVGEAGNEWGGVDEIGRDRLIQERVALAIRRRLITKQLKPLSVRR